MKTIKILLVVLSILNLIDLITASFILPGESNIIYIQFGFTPLIILKILFSIFLLYLAFRVIDRSHNNFFKFTFSYIILIAIFVYGFAVYSNVQGILDPIELAQSATIAKSVKVKYYITTMALLFGLPVLLNSIHYFIYEKWRSSNEKVKIQIKSE